MTSQKRFKLLYWTFITPVLALMAVSTTFYFSGAPDVIASLAHLGYPVYLLKILGTAKLLGIMTLLFAPCQTLKEWAYAGFTINLVGAAASHAFSGDDLGKISAPVICLILLLVSYYFWKKILSTAHKHFNNKLASSS